MLRHRASLLVLVALLLAACGTPEEPAAEAPATDPGLDPERAEGVFTDADRTFLDDMMAAVTRIERRAEEVAGSSEDEAVTDLAAQIAQEQRDDLLLLEDLRSTAGGTDAEGDAGAGEATEATDEAGEEGREPGGLEALRDALDEAVALADAYVGDESAGADDGGHPEVVEAARQIRERQAAYVGQVDAELDDSGPTAGS